MLDFQQKVKSFSDNLGDYVKSAWSLFLDDARAQMSGLSDYLVLGSKDMSMIKRNYEYIQALQNSGSTDSSGVGAYIVKGSHDKEYKLDNTNSSDGNTLRQYEEGKGIVTDTLPSYCGTMKYSQLSTAAEEGLVQKTNELFSKIDSERKSRTSGVSNEFKKLEQQKLSDRLDTVVSRFHTDKDFNKFSNSAYSKYGLSRGRNLLKKELSYENLYDDPYCRVWTWHHQYSKYVTDTMRPFSGVTMDKLHTDYGWGKFRSSKYGDSFKNGSNRLAAYGAMFDNGGKTKGLVNITPISGKSSLDDEDAVNLKHCMFSIENLAWKGMWSGFDGEMEKDGLSREQKGPLGGRIMWFPPYGLSFNENSTARWEENTFIGRGEPVYTYSNTTRSGTLSFKLLIDHPAILDYWENRDLNGVDEIESEQTLLRFFAGCDILSAGKIEEEEEEEATKTEEEASANEPPYFIVPVFFPNNYSGVNDRKNNTGVDPIEYLLNGIGAQVNYNNENIPTYMDNIGIVKDSRDGDFSGKKYGGYEMMEDNGISVIKKAYKDNDKNNTFITSAYYGDEYYTYQFYKQSGEGTESGNEWAYRVDNAYITQKFENKNHYVDNESYQLNCTGCYSTAVENISGLEEEKTYSLVDTYAALMSKDENWALSGYCNWEKVNVLKTILANNTITEIKCIGNASKAGYNKYNITLGKNRAETLEIWLKEYCNKTSTDTVNDSNEVNTVSTEEVNKNVADVRIKGDVDSLESKLARRAYAKIYYEAKEVENAEESQVSTDENGKEVDSGILGGSWDADKGWQNDNDNSKKTEGNTYNGGTLGEVVCTAKKKNVKNPRYDDEAKFFEKLEEKAPFVYKQITDKIKYFNPAFHSMTPEGFNARLTFLNQCMRQGPTISGTDSRSENPNNMSFGRAPICVLRIGDFYNTRIVITSLQIDYDPLTWDLNQEGIGVMPMIANVNIGFNFIGGSELGGPIQRLQNALSFNYYANTSVYDNRAEEIEYGDYGAVKAFKPYSKNSTIFNEDSGQEASNSTSE
jgi:hypothetical protein